MHEAAVTYRSEQGRKRNVKAKHARSQITVGHRHGVTRPESNVLKYAAVLPQRDLCFGAAIQVIENCLWQPVPSQRT